MGKEVTFLNFITVGEKLCVMWRDRDTDGLFRLRPEGAVLTAIEIDMANNAHLCVRYDRYDQEGCFTLRGDMLISLSETEVACRQTRLVGGQSNVVYIAKYQRLII